jgi:MinD superfamily P-loop ATPase
VEIERHCFSQAVEVASKIPFDNVVTEALIRRLPVVEYGDGEVSRGVEKLWQLIDRTLSQKEG